MPNYDFTCIPCDVTFEMHYSFDSTDRPICEKCGRFLIKAIPATPVHFKGKGWGGQ